MLHRTQLAGLVLALASLTGCSSTTGGAAPAPSGTVSVEPVDAGASDVQVADSAAPVENLAPAIEAAATLAVKEGESARLTVKVTDANGDKITLAVAASSDLKASLEDKGGGQYELLVEASHEAGDHQVTLTANDGALDKKFELNVDVQRMAWASPGWKFAPDGLEEREHPTTLLDTARDRILVLGGSGYRPQGKPLADTWQVSTKTGKATKLVVEGDVLPAIGSMRIAEVPGTNTAYMFGGYVGPTGDERTADLYFLDYSGDSVKLTKLVPAAGATVPPARQLHGLAYDEVGKRLVVFCGFGGRLLDDLWVGNVSGAQVTWEAKTANPKPSKRYGFFYGQFEGKVLIYSGAQAGSMANPVNPARDLWSLDIRAAVPSYTKLLEGMDVPEGRRNGSFAVDRTRGRFYVWNGTPDAQKNLPGLWVYDARPGFGKFTKLVRPNEPAIRSSGVAVIDSRDGSAYFGFGNDMGIYSDFTRFGF
jgi:hypothetical protein